MEPTRSNRDQILDAADRLMGRIGFRKMSVEDVAREAGVSRRTVYLHFANKEELGLSSVGRVVREVHSLLEELVQQDLAADEMLRVALTQRVMGRVMAVQDYYMGLDELFEAIRPAYMARRQAFFEHEQSLIAQILKRGADQQIFHVEDCDSTALYLLLATNAFLPYSLSVRELGTPESVEHRLSGMIQLLMHGVLTSATTKHSVPTAPRRCD